MVAKVWWKLGGKVCVGCRWAWHSQTPGCPPPRFPTKVSTAQLPWSGSQGGMQVGNFRPIEHQTVRVKGPTGSEEELGLGWPSTLALTFYFISQVIDVTRLEDG